jgi:hypothetical protein
MQLNTDRTIYHTTTKNKKRNNNVNNTEWYQDLIPSNLTRDTSYLYVKVI